MIAGAATEVAVQLPALSGSNLGYRVFIVVDAVGVADLASTASFAGCQACGVGSAGDLATGCETVYEEAGTEHGLGLS